MVTRKAVAHEGGGGKQEDGGGCHGEGEDWLQTGNQKRPAEIYREVAVDKKEAVHRKAAVALE